MDANVLTTRVGDGIAVTTLGSARRIYVDEETSDALFDALSKCSGGADIRVVVVTDAAPVSSVCHDSIPELIRASDAARARTVTRTQAVHEIVPQRGWALS